MECSAGAHFLQRAVAKYTSLGSPMSQAREVEGTNDTWKQM